MKSIFIKGTARSVLGLGVTTTIGYGTLYYSFTIMASQFENEFGWSKSFIFGIFSLGILLGGFSAPKVGRLLDNHGARGVMSIGSFLCALGLMGISLIQNEWHYILAIIFLQVVSTFVLYEAAFVAFSQLAGNNARVPITQITLIAGFASTIFWPLISFLLELMSWRDVYIVLALFHIFLAMPIHFLILKRSLTIHNDIKGSDSFDDSLELEGALRKKSLIVVGIVFSLIAIPVTVMQTHFLGLMQGFGIESVTAIALGALIGPAQVSARVLEMFLSRRASPITSGILSTSLMALGVLALLLSGYDIILATVFILLYGAGQGISDILRGSIPLYLFGKDSYGRTTGGINLYRNLVIASVPFGFALMLDHLGAQVSTMFLFVLMLSATLLLVLLSKNILKGV